MSEIDKKDVELSKKKEEEYKETLENWLTKKRGKKSNKNVNILYIM